MEMIKEFAFRVSKSINSVDRKDREFTKNDFVVYQPLPSKIYSIFADEFPFYTQEDINTFTKEMNYLVEA